MLAAALLFLTAATAEPPSPVQCHIAANRMAEWTVLGQGMVENLEKRGAIPPERKELYEAMKTTIAVDLPLVEQALARFKDVKSTEADDKAFGTPNPQQMRAMLKLCNAH